MVPTRAQEGCIYVRFDGGLFTIATLARCPLNPDQEFVIFKQNTNTQFWAEPRGLFEAQLEDGRFRFRLITVDELTQFFRGKPIVP